MSVAHPLRLLQRASFVVLALTGAMSVTARPAFAEPGPTTYEQLLAAHDMEALAPGYSDGSDLLGAIVRVEPGGGFSVFAWRERCLPSVAVPSELGGGDSVAFNNGGGLVIEADLAAKLFHLTLDAHAVGSVSARVTALRRREIEALLLEAPRIAPACEGEVLGAVRRGEKLGVVQAVLVGELELDTTQDVGGSLFGASHAAPVGVSAGAGGGRAGNSQIRSSGIIGVKVKPLFTSEDGVRTWRTPSTVQLGLLFGLPLGARVDYRLGASWLRTVGVSTGLDVGAFNVAVTRGDDLDSSYDCEPCLAMGETTAVHLGIGVADTPLELEPHVGIRVYLDPELSPAPEFTAGVRLRYMLDGHLYLFAGAGIGFSSGVQSVYGELVEGPRGPVYANSTLVTDSTLVSAGVGWWFTPAARRE